MKKRFLMSAVVRLKITALGAEPRWTPIAESEHYKEEEKYHKQDGVLWLFPPAMGVEEFLKNPPLNQRRKDQIQAEDRSSWDDAIENGEGLS